MKEFLSLILLFLVSSTANHAQSICGTKADEQAIVRLKNLKHSHIKIQQRNNEFTYIPIRFHLVADANGVGRVKFEDVLDQLCALNENFEPLGYKFYMKDGEVNEINDNTIYDNPGSAAGASKIAQAKNAFGKNAINIFITDKANTGSIGTTLGYYAPNQDYIVLKKSVLSNDIQVKFILGHEMGHFFGLLHTFNGWDQEPWDGTPVTTPNSPGGILNELADSSNCENAGDMLCDTPADYNLGFGWDGCRDYDGGCMDINGKLLAPEESNFMGYFIGCDQYSFSPEQSEIIIKDYESSKRSYLRVSYIPKDIPITESPSLLTPEDNSTTTYYNGVELTWNPVENASHYLIELTQGLNRSYYNSNTNKIFLTDLKEEKFYRWMVKPYSDINPCAPFSDSYSFTTGNMTSSTHNEVEEGKINIYPNPNLGNNINIEWELNNSFPVYYKIIDVTGKTYSKGTITNPINKLNNLNLFPGFYLIKFTSGDKHFFRKFIVNE